MASPYWPDFNDSPTFSMRALAASDALPDVIKFFILPTIDPNWPVRFSIENPPFINEPKNPPILSQALSTKLLTFSNGAVDVDGPIIFLPPPQNLPRLYVTSNILPSKSNIAERGLILS